MAEQKAPAGANTNDGLCALCAHAQRVTSSRGAAFWLCLRAARDRRFTKYPALPVLHCVGFVGREIVASRQPSERLEEK